MGAPTPHFYNITAGGNGTIAQLNGGSGPTGVAVGTGESNTVWDFSNVQAANWDVKCLCIGFTNTVATWASSLRFWMNDWVAVVNGVDNVDFTAGSPTWNIRYLIKRTYTDPTTFVAGDITSSPWAALPISSPGPGVDIDGTIAGLSGGGNDGSTNLLVTASNITNSKLVNAFIYVAMLPTANTEAGEYLSWGFRLSYIYPSS